MAAVLRTGLLGVMAVFLAVPGAAASAVAAPIIPTCLAADVCATVSLVPSPPAVQFELAGPGSGAVTSNPAGLNCTIALTTETGTCSYRFVWPIAQGAPALTLTVTPLSENEACANPPPGPLFQYRCSAFDGYENGVANFPVTLTPGTDISVPIHLALSPVGIGVTRSGAGSGAVTSPVLWPAGGLNCGTRCEGEVGYDKPLTLTATPASGSAFVQWTGACADQGATCTLTPKATVLTNAVFSLASNASTTTTTTATTTSTASTTTTTVLPVRHRLEALVVGARSGKSRLGFRIVEAEVATEEPVTARLVLTRGGRRIARATIPGVRPGDRVVVLPVPSTTAAGKAALTVTLTDSVGSHNTWTRTVDIPSS